MSHALRTSRFVGRGRGAADCGQRGEAAGVGAQSCMTERISRSPRISAQRPTANFRSANCGREKPGQPTQRLKVVDWPVVALASVTASDGYWSAQAWARERVPEHQLNAMLRNAEATTLQANAMPL